MDDSGAIERLMFSYAECLDAGDLEGVADLFSDAAFGGPDDRHLVVGRDAVLALLRSTVRIHPDGTPRTAHVTTNVAVEIANGSAAARSRFTVLQAADGLLLQPIIAGRYHDRFGQTEGRWRFLERRVLTDLVGDVSHHMLIDPALLGLRSD
jgi:3-phenylpropionate/cinnamic acid dioxygenase small subunit